MRKLQIVWRFPTIDDLLKALMTAGIESTVCQRQIALTAGDGVEEIQDLPSLDFGQGTMTVFHISDTTFHDLYWTSTLEEMPGDILYTPYCFEDCWTSGMEFENLGGEPYKWGIVDV